MLSRRHVITLLPGQQRRAGLALVGELLLGTPGQQTEDQPGNAFPGGEIYLSFPGLGRRLAARIAGEIGEHIEQFTPNSLQCYAGSAPVTRRSGKGDLVVARRLACNRWLKMLWYCLTSDMPYDNAIHAANRNQGLSAITARAA